MENEPKSKLIKIIKGTAMIIAPGTVIFGGAVMGIAAYAHLYNSRKRKEFLDKKFEDAANIRFESSAYDPQREILSEHFEHEGQRYTLESEHLESFICDMADSSRLYLPMRLIKIEKAL